MIQKRARSNIHFAAMLGLLAWIAGGMVCAFPAHAQTSPGVYDNYPVLINTNITASSNGQQFGYQICPIEDYNASDPDEIMANHAKWGLVKRIVYCVQGLVIPATFQIMYQNAINYFYGPIAAAMTLAVLFWGVLMATGKNSAPIRDAFTMAIKVGAVSFFTFMLGASNIWPDGLFPVMLRVVDDLVRIVTEYIGYSTSMKCALNFSPYDAWGRIDCALNTLFGGIFDPSLLLMGLVGFLVSCVFSGAFGLFIALAGFAAIFFLIMAIMRAAYITITAYVALALMAIVSPIFITLLLFNSTRGYFEKWLKLTIGFMLQPMFLFAYLAMMLAAFDTVIYDGKFSMYRAIAPANAIGTYPQPLRAYPTQNQNTNPDGEFYIGQWLIDKGVYKEAEKKSMGVGTNPRLQTPPKEQNIGILGSTGTQSLSEEAFERKDSAGILLNVIDQFRPVGVYDVNIPFRVISWQQLALVHRCPAGNPSCTADSMEDQIISNCNGQVSCVQNQLENVRINYLINLLLALLLSLLTLYLFYLMLDLMPFIGAGVTGEHYSMPAMGSGKLSMPGNGLVDKMKSGMGALVGGGK